MDFLVSTPSIPRKTLTDSPNMAVEELDMVALSFGLFVCLYGCFSYYIKEHMYIGEAPLAFLLGIALGPYGLGQLTKWDGQGEDADTADDVALGLSRIVIGVQLVLVGIQLPKAYLIHEARSLIVILLPVMICMWLITALLIQLVLPDVPYLVALILSACTTPTDPVLSNAIVKGAFADEYVPARLRNLISAESGLNDGLALPYLFLAIRLLKVPSTGQALKDWILRDVLYTVGGSIVLGCIIGLLANQALRFACRHNTIDKESFLLYGPVLGLATIGVSGALGVDDLLAAFIAGNAFTYDDWYRLETESDEVQNVLDFLLNSIFFAFAGAAVPFATFNSPDVLGTTPWRLLLLAVLVLLFRRIPPMLAFYKFIPALGDYAEASFAGYFGPIGAGAIFYASMILQEFPLDLEKDPQPEQSAELRVRQLILPVCYSLVLASLIGHTLAIPAVKGAFTWQGVGSVQLKETQGRLGDEDNEVENRYEAGEGPAPEDEAGVEETTQMQQGDERQSAGGGALQPPSTTHVTTAAGSRNRLSRQPSAGSVNSSIAFRRSDVDAAYRRGVESSWRHSSGHKLGPHVAFEHEYANIPEAAQNGSSSGAGGQQVGSSRLGLRGQRRNSAGYGQVWASNGRPTDGFGGVRRQGVDSTERALEEGRRADRADRG